MQPGYGQTESDESGADESEESEEEEDDYHPNRQAIQAEVGVVNYSMASPRVVNPNLGAS